MNADAPRDRAVARIRQSKGHLPIGIDLDRRALVWGNVRGYSLADSFFDTSVRKIADRHGLHDAFATGIDVLRAGDFLEDPLYPTGFIFHMGRCGSTLLSKALARCPEHVVVSEANVLSHIWPILKGPAFQEDEWTEANLACYRHLVLALGRRRTPAHRAYFVKFSSWNTLGLRFIRAAFPDVPVLFVYRDPAEVLVSVLRERPGFLRARGSALGAYLAGAPPGDVAALTDLAYLRTVLVRLLTVVSAPDLTGVSFLDYADLTPHHFEQILAVFGYAAAPGPLARMQEQFHYYAKDDAAASPFVPDTEAKRKAITPEIRACVEGPLAALHAQLATSAHNLARRLPLAAAPH